MDSYSGDEILLIHCITDPALSLDHKGIITAVNASMVRMTGYDAEYYIGQSIQSFFDIAGWDQSLQWETRLTHFTGEELPLQLTMIPHSGDNNGAMLLCREIGNKDHSCAAEQDEDSLLQSPSHFCWLTEKQFAQMEHVLENITDGYIRLDQDGRIIYWNHAAERMMGMSRRNALGLMVVDHIPDEVSQAFQEALGKRENTTIEYYVQDRNSWFNARLVPFYSETSIYLKDVTALKQAEQQINQMVFYDSLTGLPNQKQMNKHLSKLVSRSKPKENTFALLVMDIDRFKVLNDYLGYDHGDAIMVYVARLISANIREYDVVFRSEGDQFTIILHQVNLTKAKQIAERIMERFQQPILVAEMEIVITFSIGISVYPLHGENPEVLWNRAETAMRVAKKLGKNGYQLYQSKMDTRSSLVLEGELRKAIFKEQLELYYQPKMDIRTGRMMGVEALIRWNHPERGMIPPDQFIPLAEDTGLIISIGHWTLMTACAQNKAWQEKGYKPLVMSVNLSPRQFNNPDLAETVRKTLKESQLAPEYLELEITENIMLNTEDALGTLQKIKQDGVRIAIDDFGKGYSSLTYLKQFPIDTLKIDRSFVEDCAENDNDAKLLRSMLSMAIDFNLSVVAEGVENRQQLDFLRQNGCHIAQGFLFSRPLPVAELEASIRQLI
ncbi:Phytochrome-like protein cph2 [compost metagenome]